MIVHMVHCTAFVAEEDSQRFTSLEVLFRNISLVQRFIICTF